MTPNPIEKTLVFSDKLMLAPMVRICTLPMRLLALEYGADMVYTEELVDKKMIGSERVVNKALGTVDFYKKGALIWRTHPKEKSKLIFQLGTSDPQLALQAALLVYLFHLHFIIRVEKTMLRLLMLIVVVRNHSPYTRVWVQVS